MAYHAEVLRALKARIGPETNYKLEYALRDFTYEKRKWSGKKSGWEVSNVESKCVVIPIKDLESTYLFLTPDDKFTVDNLYQMGLSIFSDYSTPGDSMHWFSNQLKLYGYVIKCFTPDNASVVSKSTHIGLPTISYLYDEGSADENKKHIEEIMKDLNKVKDLVFVPVSEEQKPPLLHVPIWHRDDLELLVREFLPVEGAYAAFIPFTNAPRHDYLRLYYQCDSILYYGIKKSPTPKSIKIIKDGEFVEARVEQFEFMGYLIDYTTELKTLKFLEPLISEDASINSSQLEIEGSAVGRQMIHSSRMSMGHAGENYLVPWRLTE